MLRDALLDCLLQVETVLNAWEQAPDAFVELGVGRHLRHIYDHFLAAQPAALCAHNNNDVSIDYNSRNREALIERDLLASQQALAALLQWCQQLPADDVLFNYPVVVISEVNCLQQTSASFNSYIARELLYLMNHAIHHLAYIKLLLCGVGIELPSHVGIAPSTASYQRQRAAAPEGARECVR